MHGGVSADVAKAFGSVFAISAKMKELILAEAFRVSPTQNDLLTKGPLWTRDYARAPEADICPKLLEALTALGANYMVMGHTPQSEIKTRCNGRAVLIDTGISYAMASNPSALEILQERGKTTAMRALILSGERVLLEGKPLVI